MESPPESHSTGIFGQAAPERLGRYPLLSVIGTGSMGVVYKSYDPQLKSAIALKTIRRELLDDDIENLPARFRIEALAAGALTHPGIVRVHEHGEAEGYAYIAMEYVEGHSLRECFERKVRFNSTQAINILAQLLEALQYAHEHGVWHRDVKPANILLLGDGQAKVTDFGIARVESLDTPEANTIMGTPGYIAPELYLSDAFDHRIDLFAAGVVFYQLLTGVPPFVGTAEKIMFRVCYETPLPASVVARQPSLRPFDPVVLKALARHPEERFASAAEFLEALLLAKAGGAANVDETVMFARRGREVDTPTGAVAAMIASRSPSSAGGPAAHTRSQGAAGPAGADETTIVPRRALPPSRPVVADETLIALRRTSPDDPNLTIIRPIPPDIPKTEPLAPPFAADSDALEDAPAVWPEAPPASTNANELASANTPAAGWNPQMLTQIEKQLARFLGPIAGVLVRAASRETSDLVSLIQWLAARISTPPDREAFLRGAGVVSALSSGARSSNSDNESSSPRTGGGAPLTPEYIARASQLLAIHLGPIARILAKRAAQPGCSQEEFIATLATRLSDDRERARFLKALR